MLETFKEHIEKEFPEITSGNTLLAVSGGLDSMVLLHLFQQANLKFGVAHCNFQLRGEESDSDQDFVKEFCSKHNIIFHTINFDTEQFVKIQKESVQVVARNLRYDWFFSILALYDYDAIATAHHLNDSLETFLINFTRGTGLEGLLGIPKKNGQIIRPLLNFTKLEIEEYAVKNEIVWREDSSNFSEKYQRNKFRHSVIPVLQELNINLLHSFKNTLEHLHQAQSMIEDASDLVYKQVVTEDVTNEINLTKLLTYKNYKAYLRHWLSSYGFTAWEDIYGLVDAQSGKQVYSKDYVLLKDRNKLLLFPKQAITSDEYYIIDSTKEEVKFPLKLSICNVDYITDADSNTIFVDEDKLAFPLRLRKWVQGDVFYPVGMQGSKKLSKYFKDEKYSLYDKSNTWILSDNNNEIVWIVGKRQDSRFTAKETTKKIKRITLVE